MSGRDGDDAEEFRLSPGLRSALWEFVVAVRDMRRAQKEHYRSLSGRSRERRERREAAVDRRLTELLDATGAPPLPSDEDPR